MIVFIILFPLSVILLSDDKEKQVCSIKIDSFDMVTWKVDSLGCQGRRYDLAHILTQDKKKLINKKKAAIESFLGKANSAYMDGRFDSYYIEAGIQCTPKKKDETGFVEVTRLLIEYKEGTVVNVSIVTP